MMPTYLADTSAWNRSGRGETVQERWSDLLVRGELAICSPIRLELLYSARDPADYVALSDDLDGLVEFPFDQAVAARAHEVQGLLSEGSQHRAATPIDLYIAAVAELNDATLIHYDRHFDAISRVTGQAAEWISPRGSLD